jgi:hypothetical protein
MGCCCFGLGGFFLGWGYYEGYYELYSEGDWLRLL